MSDPTGSPLAPTVLDLFAQFWAAYPRRVARKDALKAWTALRPSPDLVAQMLATLAWQRRSHDWTKDGGAYVPYPATWIRGERWTDEEPQQTMLVPPQTVRPLTKQAAVSAANHEALLRVVARGRE
jgi:hypothetical protein